MNSQSNQEQNQLSDNSDDGSFCGFGGINNFPSESFSDADFEEIEESKEIDWNDHDYHMLVHIPTRTYAKYDIPEQLQDEMINYPIQSIDEAIAHQKIQDAHNLWINLFYAIIEYIYGIDLIMALIQGQVICSEPDRFLVRIFYRKSSDSINDAPRQKVVKLSIQWFGWDTRQKICAYAIEQRRKSLAIKILKQSKIPYGFAEHIGSYLG